MLERSISMFRSLFKKWSSGTRKRELFQKKVMERELNAMDELDGIFTEKQLQQNIQFVRELLGTSNDIVIHPFISAYKNTPATIMYIDGLIERTLVNEQILRPLMNDFRTFTDFEEKKEEIEEVFQYQLISMTGIENSNKWKDVILGLLSGNTILFINETDQALIISTKAWEARGIEEPISESTVRGPHEGFTETLRTNTALIRRKIRDPFLRFEQMYIGLRSQTEVVVGYIEGLTNSEIVQEVKQRLQQIEIDRINGTTEIEQLIEDNTYSIFPQIIGTERPDMVTTELLDGKVVVLSDNSPYVLVMPATYSRFQMTSDDYYERWFFGSFIRMIRFIAAFVVIAGPGLYICLTAVNPELLPTDFIISTSAGRSGVPFPVIVELLMMEITLELLREAGVRLPKPIGQAVSVVGGLVLGDAAITAGIVSPLTVVVVALTAIFSFTIPSYSFGIAIRLSRYPVTIASALFGLYGWLMSIIFIFIHLVNLKSFNVPYLSPFTPLTIGDWRDNFLVGPLKLRQMRPQYIHAKQLNRSTQKNILKHKSDNIMKEGTESDDNNPST